MPPRGPIYLPPSMRTSLLFAALAAFVLAPSASAQASGFMPYLGYNLDTENILLGVGYRFGVPLEAPVVLAAQPTIEYQFESDITILQADANLVAQLSASPALAPYVGAGLGVLIVDSEFTDANTELGLNLLGGAVFNPTGFGQPFAQVRYSTAGPDALTLAGGVILSF